MQQIRLCLGSPRFAAVLAVVALAAAAPVEAQIVHTFDQARSTNAHANAASRDNSILGFGTWKSDVQVDAPGVPSGSAGVATQTSGIYGDSTVATGEGSGHTTGAAANGDGSSNFSVHFRVDTRTGFTLLGHVLSHAAAAGGEGEASAMIQLSGPAGVLATVQTDCAVDGVPVSPCDKSDDLIASGILEPGSYLLEAHASGAARSAGDAATGEGGARFTFRIWFDGPIVSAERATWSNLKSLYR